MTEQRGLKLAPPPISAGCAVLDVPAQAVSHYPGELPVPSGEEGVKRDAALAASSSHEQCSQARPELAPGPSQQVMHAATGDSEHDGGLVGVQTLPEPQQRNVALASSSVAASGLSVRASSHSTSGERCRNTVSFAG